MNRGAGVHAGVRHGIVVAVKTLYLMRHAKSSWDEPDVDDQQRPLATRGERAARRMVKHMRERGISPAMVICSSARRAVQTLELLKPALAKDATVAVEDALYLASTADLRRRVQQVDASIDSLMLIGHNPTMQSLATTLARRGAARDRVAADFPTAALATLTIDRERWKDVTAGDAELIELVVPRELA